MSKITLGKFEVGQTVKMKNQKAYGASRRGKVVEVTPNRIRVLWNAYYAGSVAKRTWMKPESLVQVIGTPEQPAVGPGGWILDTNS